MAPVDNGVNDAMHDVYRPEEVDHDAEELQVVHPLVLVVEEDGQGGEDIKEEAREQVLLSDVDEAVLIH